MIYKTHTFLCLIAWVGLIAGEVGEIRLDP